MCLSTKWEEEDLPVNLFLFQWAGGLEVNTQLRLPVRGVEVPVLRAGGQDRSVGITAQQRSMAAFLPLGQK